MRRGTGPPPRPGLPRSGQADDFLLQTLVVRPHELGWPGQRHELPLQIRIGPRHASCAGGAEALNLASMDHMAAVAAAPKRKRPRA